MENLYISFKKYNFTVTHDRCNICSEEVIKQNYKLDDDNKLPLPSFVETLAVYTPPSKNEERGIWMLFCEKHMKEITCKTALCCVCGNENQKRPAICSNCASRLVKNTRLLEKECQVDILGVGKCKCSFCKAR